jgi:hypothetical protein
MAWPSYVTDGEVATAAQYNALVDSDASWGGSVNAGGYIVTNLASIVAAPSAVLDVSAGGFSIKGDVAASGKWTVTSNPTDGFPLTVSTAGGPSFNVLTGAGALHAQIRTSDGWLLVAQAGDSTRAIRLIAPPGQQESINTVSGRLTITGGLDVTADITAGSVAISGAVTVGSIVATGNIKAATLTVTGAASAASLATSGVLTVGTDCSVGGNLTGTGSITASQGFTARAPTDYSKFLAITCDAASNTATLGGSALALLNCTQNLQCTGWLRTVGASGFYAYSPDLSRYLQISCANGANPVIYSSTAALQISGNVTFTGAATFSGTVSSLTRLTSGGDITISVSGTGAPAGSYLQIAHNGQLDANPWFYSSTGWITFASNVAYKNGAGWGVYGPGTSGTSYLSTNWIGNDPGLLSSTGNLFISSALLVVGAITSYSADRSKYVYLNGNTANATINTNLPSLEIICTTTFDKPITVTGQISAVAGNPIVWYSAASNYGILGWDGSNPGINSNTGVLMLLCQTGCKGTGGFVAYSPDMSRYGQWNAANAGHPTLYSSTGTMVFTSAPYLANVSMTCVPAASPGINISIPATNFVGWQIIAPSVVNTTLTAGISNNINAGNQPYLYSNTATLNIQVNTLYVTGAVSATAHQTHGSGTGIEDIYTSFYREVPEVAAPVELLEDGTPPPVTEGEIPVDAWTLAPAADGLHILVKRSKTEVLETVLPWSQFQVAPQPAAGKN